MNSNAFLQLPPGSTGLFLEEAGRHQAAVDATNNLYARWGYTMVHTPMVDFFDAHSHMISEDEESRLYRMIGREGEVLMLRSDITIFLLKHFQSLLKGADFPVRLSYSDTILRHEDSIDISRNDHYQTGAELIGTDRRDGDLEILLLLCENLQALEIPSPAIHLGSRRLFNAVFPMLNSDDGIQPLRNSLQQTIINRDWAEFRVVCSAPGVAEEMTMDAEAATSLFSGIHDFNEEFSALDAAHGSSEAGKIICEEIDYLRDLAGTIARYFPEYRIRIDASEIGQRHYYSGLVFYVYVPGIPYAVASGGRYDKLIADMGMDSGAVGFQVMLSALNRLPGAKGVQKVSSVPGGSGLSIEERYEKARELRAKGQNLCL